MSPPEALLGGEDGLDLIRPLVRQAQQYLHPGGCLALEVGDGQAGQVLELLRETEAYERLESLGGLSGDSASGAGPAALIKKSPRFSA